MATLTAIANKSTVLAVQQIQALIAELNEAIERDPNREDVKSFISLYINSDDERIELTLKGHSTFFLAVGNSSFASNEVKQKALKLSELFKLFEK